MPEGEWTYDEVILGDDGEPILSVRIFDPDNKNLPEEEKRLQHKYELLSLPWKHGCVFAKFCRLYQRDHHTCQSRDAESGYCGAYRRFDKCGKEHQTSMK